MSRYFIALVLSALMFSTMGCSVNAEAGRRRHRRGGDRHGGR